MKKCELCKSQAMIYCDSDQAMLCWSCDAKVHSANFLVARHSRCLLCHICQSPTPWRASGEKLGRTVSICEGCVYTKDSRGGAEEESIVGNDDDEIDTDEDEIDTDYEDQLDVENEDGENQVVPWSSTSPPPAASSSSSEESPSRFCNSDGEVSSKRMSPDFADLCSNDDFGCSFSEKSKSTPAAAAEITGDGGTDFSDEVSLRPLKIRKVEVQSD